MSLSRRLATPRLDAALAIIRVVVGGTFVAHGAQKLFVYGFGGVTGAFAQMGVPLPGVIGPLVAFVEFFGGLALIVGLLTRLASLGLAATMAGAILIVHIGNGFFNPNGVEFPLSLLASTVALALAGAGAYSADALIGRRPAPATVPEGRAVGSTRRAA